MTRTTVTIDDEKLDALRSLAAERGVSVSCLVREAIDEKLSKQHPSGERPKPKALGSFSSEKVSLSRLASDFDEIVDAGWYTADNLPPVPPPHGAGRSLRRRRSEHRLPGRLALALILDTGPLYASLDRHDPHYAASRALLEAAREPLVIPSPVLVEVDHLLERRAPTYVMPRLLRDIARGAFRVEELLPEDYARAAEICEQYADARVGFVDAAVLSVVERLGEPKLATLDHRHFGLLRPRHIDALELVPQS